MLDGVDDGYRQPICGAPDLGRQDLGGGHPHQGAVANVEHEDVNLGENDIIVVSNLPITMAVIMGRRPRP